MTQPLPSDVVSDLVAGVSKLALGWMKARKAQDENWTSGSFDLDLEAALGGDVAITAADYDRLAQSIQRVLQVNYPNTKYQVNPRVTPVMRPEGTRIYVCFTPVS